MKTVAQLGTDLRGAERTYRPWVGVELAVGGAYEIRTNPHPTRRSVPRWPCGSDRLVKHRSGPSLAFVHARKTATGN